MKRLHFIKLDRKPVAAIETLDFDEKNEIYLMLERNADVYTGDEDDTYSLRSLADIDAVAVPEPGLLTLGLVAGAGWLARTRGTRKR